MGMRAAALAVLLGALPVAGSKVLVLATPGAPVPATFVETLRIQLADAAVVEEGPALPEGPLAERVARAATLAQTSGAVLAVWLERAPAAEEVVVYAVSRHRERALIQVVRVPLMGSEAERNRVIALKVGELADAALAAGPVLQPDRAPARPVRATGGRAWGLVLEAGAAGALGAGDVGAQLGTALLAGVRHERDRLGGEAYATWRAMRELEVARAAGRVFLDEQVVALGGRARLRRQRLGAGLYLEGSLRLVDATGVTPDGRAGASLRVVPTLAGGLEGRIQVVSWLAIRLAAGLEGAFVRQRFALDGLPVADLGRLRPVGQLSVVVTPP